MTKTLLDIDTIITPWKPPPQTTYIFTHARVVNPANGHIDDDTTVVLSGGVVYSVGDASYPPGSDATTIDLQGKYIIPGLWDCHVHLAAVHGSSTFNDMLETPPDVVLLRQPEVGQGMLDRGFTTVRDCGGALLPLKKAFEEGVHPGPRIFMAGRQLSQSGGCTDKRGPYEDKICCGGATQIACRTVDGVPECLKFAREELRMGSDFIKIMAGGGVSSPRGELGDIEFTPEEIRAITTVTSNAGTFTTAHAYTPLVIQQAVNNGVLGIEHGNYLDEPTAKLMAEKGVYFTPTLAGYAAGGMEEFDGFIGPHEKKKLGDTLEAGLNSLRIARDAGITMCLGTDLFGPMHFLQTKEFEIRSRALSSLEILQSATVNGARMMRKQDSLGLIAPGFIADLLILNANPLDDITVLDRPEEHLLATFKEGRVVSSRWSELEVRSRRPAKIM